MPLNADDRWAIAEVLALHGHLFDEGQLDRLDEIFTADVVYDLEDFGQEPLRGIDEIRRAAVELGDGNPVGHHVTNVVVTEADRDTVTVRSKGIGIMADGSCASVSYVDELRRERAGWRIGYRKLIRRRVPLGAS